MRKKTDPKKKSKLQKDQHGRTPGKSSYKYKKKAGVTADTRNRVSGQGGGVKRKASPKLKAASKKQIKTARKMNQARGRKYKKR